MGCRIIVERQGLGQAGSLRWDGDKVGPARDARQPPGRVWRGVVGHVQLEHVDVGG